jgi:hypothetical protein
VTAYGEVTFSETGNSEAHFTEAAFSETNRANSEARFTRTVKPASEAKKRHITVNKNSHNAATRKVRIPDDFKVTEEHREFARSKGLPDPEAEFEGFRDFHTAQARKFLPDKGVRSEDEKSSIDLVSDNCYKTYHDSFAG